MATAMILNPLISPISLAEISYASGAFTIPRPGSLSGQSTRSRRSNRSSSDSDPVPEFDGFMEEDLRAGGPRLCEAPCETLWRVPDTMPQYRTLTDPAKKYTQNIRRIAGQEGLQVLEVAYCGRRPLHAPEQKPQLTVLLFVHRRDPTERGWIGIARKILAYLTGTGINGITVEILDQRFDQRPHLFACLPTDPIYQVWQNVGPAIVDQIDLTRIVTVGCYRIGASSDRQQCPVTVVVGVDRRAQRDWKPTREHIVRILDSFGLPTVGVLIRLDGHMTRMNTQPATPAPSTHIKEIAPGASLSPHKLQNRHRGTFGGWVEIRSPSSGNWLTVGLTCHHCVFPLDAEFSGQDLTNIMKWKENGVPAGDKEAGDLLIIDVPSKVVLREKIDELARQIKSNSDIPVYQEVKRLKEADEFVRPGQENQCGMIQSTIDILEEERRHLKGMYHRGEYIFGRVFATSGLRQSHLTTTSTPNSLLSNIDWALVRPQGHPAPSNKVPHHESLPVTQLFSFDFGKIKRDEPLFKVGTTTGITEGVYGALKECAVAIKVADGQEVSVTTWEHTILARHVTEPVTREGDTGCLIFNKGGDVVGLLFAGSNSNDRGFFTHSVDLVADIKAATGASEVRLLGDDGT
ncbi:hypothetical protein BDW59DRAFT_150909 [Aspergillus cavernicola]|uniref:Uncharacterized protein n=1 Tax=Aspergillus cavernicola TaxID=176166 RepID=A0ABR4HZZ4_9EURO